jgi:predicted dehydrogenase
MTVRAGLAGLGRWGQVLTNAIKDSDAITFPAACTGRKERAVDFCAEHGIDLRDSLDDLLADPSLDAIVLATPHTQHAEQMLACAKAGKHVFVEKPFTMSVDTAESAAQALADAGLICAPGFNRRFLPSMQRMREIVSSGRIGTPLHVEANISVPAGVRATPGHWRGDPNESPAGSMTALGVHMIDSLISLMGPVTEVRATSERRMLTGDIDDVTFMTLRFADGSTGYMSTLFSTARIWYIRVMGSEGWVSMRGYKKIAVKSLDQGDEEETLETFEKPDIERLELTAFADAVQNGSAYPVPVADAIHGVAVLRGIVESAKSGDAVTL